MRIFTPNMYLKMLFAKCRPFCTNPNVLKHNIILWLMVLIQHAAHLMVLYHATKQQYIHKLRSQSVTMHGELGQCLIISSPV